METGKFWCACCLAAAFCTMTGCIASTGLQPPSRIEDAIDEALAGTADVTRRIAAMEPRRIGMQKSRTPKPLTSPLIVRWSGPVRPLLESMAAAAGYQLETAGPLPATETRIAASFTSSDLPEALEKIGAMLPEGMSVAVDEDAGRIILSYGA